MVQLCCAVHQHMDGQSCSMQADKQDSKQGNLARNRQTRWNWNPLNLPAVEKERKQKFLITFNDVLIFFQQISIISNPFVLIHKTN